jgi:gluconate 2-dehydrogenase gamma chain
MESADLTRRSLLQALAATLATTAVPFGWSDVAHAMDQAHAAAARNDDKRISFLSRSEAADVEAVAAQIIPTDDVPGAREAGVVYFIDCALATFYSQLADDYRTNLAAFQSACHGHYPAAVSFASLSSEQQIAFLRSGGDQTPFFSMTRLLTLLGMFALPSYGANRNGVGWRLIGFEDSHAFYPPFGYYDRDYPGFVIDTVKNK